MRRLTRRILPVPSMLETTLYPALVSALVAALATALVSALLSGCAPQSGDTPDSNESSPGGQIDDPLNAQISQAQQHLGNSEFPQAAEILESVVEADPERAQAWQLLAIAHRNAGDNAKAKQAYLRAHDFPVNQGGAVMGLILVYATEGELDQAAEWLGKAEDTPGVDLGSIAARPELQALRDDERFSVLFPPAELFDQHPFLENVTVLHEWRGAEGDSFGWEGRAIGDVDGDGAQDAVVSAPANSPPGDNKGRVDVFSGRTGQLLWQAHGRDGSQLGIAIEAAHDVNRDGVPDVVAGATGVGEVYVYSGSDGAVLLTIEAPDGAARFGNKVAGIGDVDSDGHADILVGAPGQSPDDPGKAYVYSGADGALLLELRGDNGGDGFGTSVAGAKQGNRLWLVIGAPSGGPRNTGEVAVYTSLSPERAFTIEGEASAQQLGGMFLSVVGDTNGDGVDDIYASDWPDNAKGPQTGRIYVHSGKDGERLITLTGEGPGDGFGIGPARAGDFDGDGADDLVIGAWQEGSGAFSGGKVYLYSGRTGQLMGAITGKVPGDTFGFDTDGLGDVNGDEVPDLLVTSAWSMVAGPRSGRTFVISGAGLIDP